MARKLLNSRRMTTSRRNTRRRARTFEALERRALMAGDLSISDATAIEGDDALKFIDRFVTDGSGGLERPRRAVFGPDGSSDGIQDLYVASADTHEILRYDGVTGAFLDDFVTQGSGGLNSPGDMAWGHDGNLYVSSLLGNQVLRYSGTTGTFMDVVASGLSGPLGLNIGSDGSLYIANQDTDEVLRYDGAAVSTFISAGSGGLDTPRNADFGPDANGDGVEDLYVGTNPQKVLRFDGLTGEFIDVFATVETGAGLWLQFGPDGYLYASHRISSLCCDTNLSRLDGMTGSVVDTFALGRDGWSFNIAPDGLVYNSSNGDGSFVERFGHSSLVVFTVTLSSPNTEPVVVSYSTADGTAAAMSDYIPSSGTLTFAPGQTSRTILIQTMDDSPAESNETFSVILSDPQGAVLADGTGVATISDNDSTKFYVVNDATQNQTFEYAPAGSLIESYALSSGNSAPRGAASTAAGDKVWVVDANRKVYVYNASGALLGSWTAGSLSSSASVQGIATNGTDIWIVDAKSDKVYRYAGAASRTSGSQNAASSFSLNSGNRDATDIVQGGGFLWVTNNTLFTDKVFKYTLSGSLVGSWTISAAGGSPTGITLDLGNNSDLWIVDSATDRAYQYIGAASRTSGSQSAATFFPLAAGNTNPQGIADPPAGGAAPLTGSSADMLDSHTLMDLARSAASRRAAPNPTQSLLPRKPDRVVAPASPILGPPEARDMAITDLFDENALTFVRLAANRPLAIEPLSEDLATPTW